MKNTGKNTTQSKTQRLVGLGILTAIIIVLQVLTTYFPTKPFAITLAIIPIVIGGALYGKGAGAYLGAVFSVIVIIMCVIGADIGGAMVWQANPLLCILVCMLKGSAAGFAAGWLYELLGKVNNILGVVAAAIAAPIVNTGIFLLGLFIFFQPTLNAWAEASGQTNIVFYAICIMTGVNFLVELGVNVVLSPVVVRIIQAIKNSR